MNNSILMRLFMLASSICLPTHTLLAMDAPVVDNSAQSAEIDDEISTIAKSVANMVLTETSQTKLSPPPGLTHPSNAAAVFDAPTPVANLLTEDIACGLCDGCAESTECNRSPLSTSAKKTPQPKTPPNSEGSPSPISIVSNTSTHEADRIGSDQDCHEVEKNDASDGWSPYGRDELANTDKDLTSNRRHSPLKRAVHVPSEEEVIANIIQEIKALPDYNHDTMPEELLRKIIKTVLSGESVINDDTIVQAVMAELLDAAAQAKKTALTGKEVVSTEEHVKESSCTGCRRMKAKACEHGRQAYDLLPEQAKQLLDLVAAKPATAAAFAMVCLASLMQVR